jgi:hypothetical protein
MQRFGIFLVMAIVSCEKGHYYDDEKYGACPFCADPLGVEADDKTEAFMDCGNDDVTVGFSEATAAQDERTVGFFEERLHMDPLVGWLVCKDGPERGRDWRLHTGRNHIGSSFDMDVAISGDSMISREKHCSVVYDPKHDEFLIVPGAGTITYYKGVAITEPVALESGDEFSAGHTVFVFIAYCKGERNWL